MQTERLDRWGVRLGICLLLGLAAGWVGPASAEAPKCPAQERVEPLEATQPLNLGQLKRQLFQYKCFHYDDEVAATLSEAQHWVEERAPQVTKPALVLDIDETSLSNWAWIIHNDYGFILDGSCDLDVRAACGFVAWLRSAQAEAIKPTLALFNAAKAKNVAVFFITGRGDDPDTRAATEANLHKVGYDGWNGLVLRPKGSREPSAAPYKSEARGAIEAQGFTIIANVGDQHSDLDGGHAERTFKVPNPFYYIP